MEVEYRKDSILMLHSCWDEIKPALKSRASISGIASEIKPKAEWGDEAFDWSHEDGLCSPCRRNSGRVDVGKDVALTSVCSLVPSLAGKSQPVEVINHCLSVLLCPSKHLKHLSSLVPLGIEGWRVSSSFPFLSSSISPCLFLLLLVLVCLLLLQ